MERPGATTLGGNPMTLVGPELKAGDPAPDFSLLDSSLKPVTLSNTGATTRIFSVLPSLDTPICDAQTKRFNEESVKLPGVDIYTVSMDLPFAQKRFCGAEGIANVATLSLMRNHGFAKDYGVLIEDGPLAGLTARAVVVVDADNKVLHSELVAEIGSEPNYDAALNVLA